jgi:hypothetical protein
MVVFAVICEPVSTCNSLLTGKSTGNFAFLGPQKPISLHETTVLQRLSYEISYADYQRKYFEKQQIFKRYRGFSAPESAVRIRPKQTSVLEMDAYFLPISRSASLNRTMI